MTSILIKVALIFLGMGAAALVAMQTTAGKNVLGGLASGKDGGAKDVFQRKFDIGEAVSNVLPAFTEAPPLAPLINTKNNIQRSVESIINLPQEEKAAFCKQVCSP